MKITSGNDSFILKNCFKLLFCTQLTNHGSYLSEQNIFNRQRQTLPDVSTVSLFYSSYCNIFDCVETYITMLYHKLLVCTNIY